MTAHYHRTLVLTAFVAIALVAGVTSEAVAGAKESKDFDEPLAVAVSGQHVWVTNVAGNSVTEFNASTGSEVRVISAQRGRFQTPIAITIRSNHVWVVNEGVRGEPGGTGSISELNANTGALIRVIDDRAAMIDNPAGLAVSGSRVWVSSLQTASKNGSLTTLDATTGAVLRVDSTTDDQFNSPAAVAENDGRVWVASSGTKNYEGNGLDTGAVTEINATSGAVLRVIQASVGFNEPTAVAVGQGQVWISNLYSSYLVELNASNGSLTRLVKSNSLDEPLALALSGGDVWAVNFQGNDVTEVNASNGTVVRVLTKDVDQPSGIAAASGHVWVTNGPRNSVTEFNARTGALIRVVR
jgi:streptogramin lyase